MLSYITWTVTPDIVQIGPFAISWYGVFFALSFLIGSQLISSIFRQEGKPASDVDSLLIYMVVSTVVGARLGHFLFYEPATLWQHPLEVILPPYRGLASHGAAIGILTGLLLYVRSRRSRGQSFLWVADRIAIVVALSGFFIRLGNLMNSEIVGRPTTLPWGVVFVNNTEYAPVARHPAQLYEALTCLLLFGVLLTMWRRTKRETPQGLLLGIFFVWVFTLRFGYEFLKENQVAFENQMPLNVGQLLSIPAIMLGIYLIVKSLVTEQRNHQAASHAPLTKT
ncbi:prolipoprotein diacylglyceryl transferase [Spirosoma sordidisoli]|uniref:Phosphatidylglycerol--prolipoprotein diacylglyceryl transferase n=1 Tax=Spirosoma sordidisoli TaxID=2502893 RepID=A0A4Q2UJ02_9BACT|nr:prolipoprotein diacylglyceryl transferase [Spirosoma sordidisoli]RYC66739.1 prolipoprotein diacylglyceryl transferase [Spirosoma sordidisoli]